MDGRSLCLGERADVGERRLHIVEFLFAYVGIGIVDLLATHAEYRTGKTVELFAVGTKCRITVGDDVFNDFGNGFAQCAEIFLRAFFTGFDMFHNICSFYDLQVC